MQKASKKNYIRCEVDLNNNQQVRIIGNRGQKTPLFFCQRDRPTLVSSTTGIMAWFLLKCRRDRPEFPSQEPFIPLFSLVLQSLPRFVVLFSHGDSHPLRLVSDGDMKDIPHT